MSEVTTLKSGHYDFRTGTARQQFFSHILAAKRYRRDALIAQAQRSTVYYLFSSGAREHDEEIAWLWSKAHSEINKARRLRKAGGIYLDLGPRPDLRDALNRSLAMTPRLPNARETA